MYIWIHRGHRMTESWVLIYASESTAKSFGQAHEIMGVAAAGMMAAIVNLWMSGQKERVPYEVIYSQCERMRIHRCVGDGCQFEVPPELCTSRPLPDQSLI